VGALKVTPVSRTRILIVDDHLAFAEALAVGLAREPDLDVVAAVSEPRAAERIVRDARPHVALLDLYLQDGDGISLGRKLRSIDPSLKLVIMTAQESADAVIEAVRGGANCWVSKTASLPDLIDTIRGALHGETRIPPYLLTDVIKSLTWEQGQRSKRETLLGRLTPREREVLSLMVDGADRREMATMLHLSSNTVRTHVQNVISKLETHSTLEAMAVALRYHLVSQRSEVSDQGSG
jgi:DNA-binding NarL/FixJ family response regulator